MTTFNSLQTKQTVYVGAYYYIRVVTRGTRNHWEPGKLSSKKRSFKENWVLKPPQLQLGVQRAGKISLGQERGFNGSNFRKA